MNTLATFENWLQANRSELKDNWEAMGLVERYEEGGDFKTYCEAMFEDGYGQ